MILYICAQLFIVPKLSGVVCPKTNVTPGNSPVFHCTKASSEPVTPGV